MWWPAAINAASIVAANAGVPIKTRSNGFLGGLAVIARLPRVAALSGRERLAAFCFGKLAQDHPPLDEGKVVDKQDAVEMFDLVLQASGEKPRGVDLAYLVHLVEIAQSNFGWTGDV